MHESANEQMNKWGLVPTLVLQTGKRKLICGDFTGHTHRG